MTALTIYKRDTVNIDITVKDSAGSVVDITGYTFFFTVKAADTDADANALITKDVTSHTDAANGETRIALTPTDTNVATGNHYYDIQMKDASGNITTITADRFYVTQDITVRTS